MKQIILTAFLICVGAISSMAQNEISTLKALFQLVDENSRAIKVLKQGVIVAENDVTVAKNAFLPDASFSASVGYNGNAWVCDRDFSNGQSFSSPHFANSFAIEASMLVFAGGAIINNVKAKELKAQIEKWNLEECRQQVYFLVASYYLDFCKNVNHLEILDKNISQTQMMIKEMNDKALVGIVLDNDITRYEVQLQTLIYNRKQVESTVKILKNRLITMLDLPENTSISADTVMLSLQMPEISIEDAQSLAISNSPALNKSDLQIQLTNKNLAITKSNFYPQIRFYAGDNLKGPITYEIPTLNNNINVWYFGIGLNYNIGSLYKVPKELSKISALQLQDQAQQKYKQEEIILNVHDCYVRYLDSFQLVETQEKTLNLARENYDIIANKYNNGLVLATDLVDADNLRLTAEIQLVDAKINIVFNYYKLLFAAGAINLNN